jgi:hypothetical protein
VQLVEDRMADPGDGQCLLALGDPADEAQVGARRQDERLAGDHDRGDVVAGQRGVKCRVQLTQAARAEGGRPGVVQAVVQRDQHAGAGAVREGDIAAERPGDHLVLGARRGPLDQPPQLITRHSTPPPGR